MVTIVRKRIVYDEVCIPFSEFEKVTKDIKDICQYGVSKDYASWNDLDFELDTCQDLSSGYTRFAAFEGDIYTMTDDVIANGQFDWHHSIDEMDIAEPSFVGTV